MRQDDARHLPPGAINLYIDALLSQLGIVPHLRRQLRQFHLPGDLAVNLQL
jgi:hypothetical protein